MNERPLLVTGMARSGITPIAQTLLEAGLFLGDRTGGRAGVEPYGQLEDADVVAFHRSFLPDWEDAPDLDPRRSPRLGVEAGSAARRLVEAKFKDRPTWGWKDPRAVPFLDHWNRVLPEARWIFAYRAPARVAWSLVYRGDLRLQSELPAFQARLALRLWIEHARRILAFARANRGRCLLLEIPGDLTAESGERFDRVVRERWGYPLEPVRLATAYRAHLLKRANPRWLGLLARLEPAARRLHRELRQTEAALWREHGEPASLPPPPAAAFRPSVALVSRRPGEYSQTFIHAHATWMPVEVRFLYGAGRRLRDSDGLLLLSPGERLIRIIAREFRLGDPKVEKRSLRRWLRRKKVDAVLAEFGQTGVDVMDACIEEGVPFTVHFHGWDAHSGRVLREMGESYRAMLPRARAIVAVSRKMEEQLLALGAPRDRLFYNPCGVDPDAFRLGDPSARPPTFLSTGRFVNKKAPVLLLLAFARVVESCPDARLVMIGDGEIEETARQLARALGIASRVDFVGALPHGKVRRRMREARAFVQHSIEAANGDSEGLPVALLEASSSGLPVVATRHAGIVEAVIEGETGFLVDEEDVEGTAEAMLRLALDPELAARLGRRGRDLVVAEHAVADRCRRLADIVLGRAAPDPPRPQ